MFSLPLHGGGNTGKSAGMIEEEKLSIEGGSIFRYWPKQGIDVTSPSGRPAALRPYMSASNSMVRVMVLPTGVVMKK